ncbi:MAG: hypothetical protein ACR2PM_17520, partial [Hyphomicrobiales bacterium]
MKPLRTGIAAVLSSAALLAGAQALAADDAPHWGYSGKADPSVWAELSDAYKVCGVGVQQSPVDIETSDLIASEPAGLSVKWQA